MKENLSQFTGFTRLIASTGLLVLTLAGAIFLSASAEMRSGLPGVDKAVVDTTQRPDTLGKLTFARTTFFFSGANINIYSANPDGSAQTPLTAFPPNASVEPTWSPDGTKIAYVAFFGSAEIYVMNGDGSGQTNLTNTMTAMERNPTWSVTGKIAYERDSQIWMMNADGSNQIQFPGITQPTPTTPAWSPDGSQLAFASGGEIYVINANGTGEHPVTNNPAVDSDPAWSPDGSKLIFSRTGSSIFVINADGMNEQNLSHGADDREPVWSSDGTKIAFVRKATTSNGIYLMDVNGANQVRVIVDQQSSLGNENNSPAWQPVASAPNTFVISGRITRAGVGLSGVTLYLNGSTATTVTDAAGNYQFNNLPAGGTYSVTPWMLRHVFTLPSRTFILNANQIADFTAQETCQGTNCISNGGKIVFSRGGSDIFVMNPDGTNQTNLTNDAAFDEEPTWSPDGSKIAFSTRRDGNWEIYTINADGSNLLRLTNQTADDRRAWYSPDGSKIVFTSMRDGNTEIYTMNPDGSNQVRLTVNTVTDDTPSYSPDGSKIIFVHATGGAGSDVYTMNADGTNQTNLTNQPRYYANPFYSPDGSKIILSYGGDVTTQAVYTMNANGTNPTLFATGFRHATYSPDGRKVVMSILSGSYGIYIRDAGGNGQDLMRLTTQLDLSPMWQPARAVHPGTFDFDGDRKTDISVFRPSNGYWYLSRSQDGFTYAQFGISTDKLAPADYDGDNRTDFAVFRENPADPQHAKFYILTDVSLVFTEAQFGATGDVPVAGDWDGDGRADLAVYRDGAQAGGQSYFFYRPSSQPGTDFIAVPWGTGADKPVSADYDGDGRTDAAVFRPSTGAWYVLQSSNNQLYAVQFGAAGDKAVPADYDGDGRADVAVYRAGAWYELRSQQGFSAMQFGLDSDMPVPADYDGDGRADLAVFRAGVWHVLQTTNNYTSVSFGNASDIPIPGAYIR